MRKQGDGYVIRSEESITLDDALPYPLITVTDPSHSFRMTLNVSLTTTANPLLLFRMTPNGNHMLRLFNSQLTADNFYLLTAFSTMSTDFSHNSGGHPAMSSTFTGTKKEQAPSAVPAPFFLEVPYFLAARAATWAFNSSSSDLISLFSACILSFFSFKSLIWFAISTLE